MPSSDNLLVLNAGHSPVVLNGGRVHLWLDVHLGKVQGPDVGAPEGEARQDGQPVRGPVDLHLGQPSVRGRECLVENLP